MVSPQHPCEVGLRVAMIVMPTSTDKTRIRIGGAGTRVTEGGRENSQKRLSQGGVGTGSSSQGGAERETLAPPWDGPLFSARDGADPGEGVPATHTITQTWGEMIIDKKIINP